MDRTLSWSMNISSCSQVDGAKFTVFRIWERFSRLGINSLVWPKWEAAMRCLFVLMLLVGCATKTPEERAAYRQAQYEAEQAAQQQSNREYTEKVMALCRGYGFSSGPEMRDCVMKVDLANRQQNAAMQQMILQQAIQQEAVNQQRALPRCADMGAGMRGYMQAQGQCR
jgi:hypothetical protein